MPAGREERATISCEQTPLCTVISRSVSGNLQRRVRKAWAGFSGPTSIRRNRYARSPACQLQMTLPEDFGVTVRLSAIGSRGGLRFCGIGRFVSRRLTDAIKKPLWSRNRFILAGDRGAKVGSALGGGYEQHAGLRRRNAPSGQSTPAALARPRARHGIPVGDRLCLALCGGVLRLRRLSLRLCAVDGRQAIAVFRSVFQS
jgi:hypothetical protein